ncbi:MULTISPECIES: glycosyltransferase [Acetobacter]|jgi:glycosyltransferase involved in cell wall biosynthesis|uniref:Glycosyltransferase involved in cell wall biosynthesis n=1 Tax=Acetobacter lovaniensis TaxID=104100 RepID=A0A841QE25_9PROT|nr:glycosyltransferase [Acetobacter lovaniensis]MBB6456524.1 glycosyltransferase involved in cell wall biosynthesis [Acetobacter lovaniensis]MCI1698045.1 glycosyltransferase [Acetobacter lovaniensis]MCP1238838.1 glycosyltransferase [Acetobacter lovaniensis]NHN80887.1 glycosyltransferase [Acetobacter lovaniensis]GBQ62776.1 glycosyltransferase [Acetobacter lovaniensis NRIC 0474]
MKTCLVYRDRLLPASEHAFMRRQYMAFSQLQPYWVGCHRDNPPADMATTLRIIGEGHVSGGLRRLAFRQLGWGAGRAVADLAPVVVHAQFGRGGALALPIARQLGLPLVVTFHGGDAFKDRHYASRFPPPIFQRRWQSLLDYSAMFVCVSDGVRDRLLERGVPARKLEVLHIGTEDVPPVRGPFDRLVFAGRFVEKKGLPVLLDALRILAGQGLTPPVVLAGDGPMRAAMEQYAAGLEHVCFAGWLSAGQLRQQLEHAVALVVPSVRATGGDREGLPSVAAEAMMYGVPVVASSEAGLEATLLDGGGLVVPAGDAQALAQALAHVLQAGVRTGMGQAARMVAREQLRASVQSARLEQRLLSVL